MSCHRSWRMVAGAYGELRHAATSRDEQVREEGLGRGGVHPGDVPVVRRGQPTEARIVPVHKGRMECGGRGREPNWWVK
jgi:hypothetical protein